jgi:hypothetical protein
LSSGRRPRRAPRCARYRRADLCCRWQLWHDARRSGRPRKPFRRSGCVRLVSQPAPLTSNSQLSAAVANSPVCVSGLRPAPQLHHDRLAGIWFQVLSADATSPLEAAGLRPPEGVSTRARARARPFNLSGARSAARVAPIQYSRRRSPQAGRRPRTYTPSLMLVLGHQLKNSSRSTSAGGAGIPARPLLGPRLARARPPTSSSFVIRRRRPRQDGHRSRSAGLSSSWALDEQTRIITRPWPVSRHLAAPPPRSKYI